MQIEDCSKDELVYLIRRRCLYTPDDIEFDILMYRQERDREKASSCTSAAGESLKKYIDIMAPYAGKAICVIPDSVFKSAADALKNWEKHIAKWAQIERKMSRRNKRIMELLDREEN